MDVFEQISRDHREIREILERMLAHGSREGELRSNLMVRLVASVLAHFQAEEKAFYPLLLDAGPDQREEALEYSEEHRICRMLLENLNDTPTDSELWKPRLMALRDVVEHHMEKEEVEAFDKAKTLAESDKLEKISGEFEAIKREQLRSNLVPELTFSL